MPNAALDINVNVTIKLVDKHGNILDTRKVHNKANRSLVSGIIQFLQGSFNPSEFNDPYEKYSNPDSAVITNALAAKKYIPSCTGVGYVGVVINDSGHGLVDHTLIIDSDQQAKPSFFETDLQVPVPNVARVKFSRVRPTVGLDINNSEGLSLNTVFPKGYLVIKYQDGKPVYDQEGHVQYRDNYFWYYGADGDWSEANKKKAMAITEVGLYSNTDSSQGLLLARVLLDGQLAEGAAGQKGVMADKDYPYNPLIQTEDTSVIVEWNIGIISIGTNDSFIQTGPIMIDSEVISS